MFYSFLYLIPFDLLKVKIYDTNNVIISLNPSYRNYILYKMLLLIIVLPSLKQKFRPERFIYHRNIVAERIIGAKKRYYSTANVCAN